MWQRGGVSVTIFSRRPDSMIAGKQHVENRVSEGLPKVTASRPGDPYVDRCRQVLELWLRWDEEQRALTERMFAAGQDQQQLEQLLDEVELLRQTAVEATRAVLAIYDPSAPEPPRGE
jgi:hypothetical protein